MLVGMRKVLLLCVVELQVGQHRWSVAVVDVIAFL